MRLDTDLQKQFSYRLGEAFYNLQWLYMNHRGQFNFAEFQMFERCYLDLRKAGALVVLTAAYESRKQTLSAQA